MRTYMRLCSSQLIMSHYHSLIHFYLIALTDLFEDKLDQLSTEVLEMLNRIQKKLKEEEELTMELVGLGGVIKMLLAASSVTSEKSQAPLLPPLPSVAAQRI